MLLYNSEFLSYLQENTDVFLWLFSATFLLYRKNIRQNMTSKMFTDTYLFMYISRHNMIGKMLADVDLSTGGAKDGSSGNNGDIFIYL